MNFFAWLKSLFTTAKPESLNTAANDNVNADFVPTELNAGISFHNNLVTDLKNDHPHLLGLYTSVLESIDKAQYAKITGQLETFKIDFNAHLTAENIKFYGYLEQVLREEDNGTDYANMRKFRREMNSIANAVNKFLNNWITAGIDSTNVVEFKTELEGIGAALVKRIESEETTLYPIYHDKNAA